MLVSVFLVQYLIIKARKRVLLDLLVLYYEMPSFQIPKFSDVLHPSPFSEAQTGARNSFSKCRLHPYSGVDPMSAAVSCYCLISSFSLFHSQFIVIIFKTLSLSCALPFPWSFHLIISFTPHDKSRCLQCYR